MLNLPDITAMDITGYSESYTEWCKINLEAVPTNIGSQKSWDMINVERLITTLHFESERDQARFLAIQKPESSAWLHMLASKELGTQRPTHPGWSQIG